MRKFSIINVELLLYYRHSCLLEKNVFYSQPK